MFVLFYVIYSNEPPHLGRQTLHHFEWSIEPRVSVTAVNTHADVDNGGRDDCGKKVVAVGKNSLGKEKPKPTQSTIFLSIEGS